VGGGQWVPGIVVNKRAGTIPTVPQAERTRDQWEHVVTSFALHSSPEAYRLAAYLSKSPFTLPVARLVQDAKFGTKASHTQLAEIMLSGLVQRLTKAGDPLPPEWVKRTGQRTALRVAEVVAASPAAASGLRAGDLILAVAGNPLGDAQSLQRLLFEEAIGSRLEITVLRNGALVDAVTVPAELGD